ncbi:MAG: hypothetical protein ACLFUI_08475 [Halanaerobiales bacterium]
MKNFGFGCIGIGQGGTNIAEQFATEFRSIAIDTAAQNLNNCSNIKESLRFHAKINEIGGAGKEVKLGEKAIIMHQDNISNMISLNFSSLNYVFLAASLGGGTGTLGITQVSRILSSLGIPHGMIVTLPAKQEGTDEKVNAAIGLYAIEQIRRKFRNLHSIVVIENEKLKEVILNSHDVAYENMWEKANNYIFKKFYNVLQFTQETSSYTIDGQDYIKVLMKDGYMIFGSTVVDALNNELIDDVKNILGNNIFVDHLELNKSKGLAMVINRPEKYKDSRAIEHLFAEMNSFIGSGTFAHGIYNTKNNLLDRAKDIMSKKSIEIFTVLSGMPFPIKRYNQLKQQSEDEINSYKGKDDLVDFDIDLDSFAGYIDTFEKQKEDIEFCMFEHDEPSEKLSPINWDNFKKSEGGI